MALPAPSKTDAPATLLTEALYRLVGRTRRLLWTAAARGMEAQGESIFAWQMVCYLVRNGPTAQRDLAHFTAQDPAGVSRVVDELLEKKHVRRRQDAQDRRKQIVEATAKGRAWFEAASPEVMLHVEEALAALSGPQRRQLKELLEALLQKPDGK